MKRTKVLIFVFFLLITLTGCKQNITLHQPKSEIVQIDLVYSPFGEKKILFTLTDDEITSFLDRLLALKLRKNSSPQNMGGGLFAQIIYSDASVELLGSASVAYLPHGGLMEHDGWYYLLYDDLFALFSEYIDFSNLGILE